jgi:ferredoxin-type protein NapH
MVPPDPEPMLMSGRELPGQSAVAEQGWLKAHKWLLLRRASQLSILGLFLLGPLTGVWIVKGNLSASMTLDFLPLTDPMLLLQAILAGHWPELTGLVGALIVIAFYAVVGGRVFCSWVCPVNMVTDSAAWLRRRLDVRGSGRFTRSLRYWILGLALVLALSTGVIVWEYINPVSMLHRGIIFGIGLAWVILLGVFLFDLLIARQGWCGHLCPVGAFYGLLGARSLVRVSAPKRARCDDCMDCFYVCPEPQVIKPALKGAAQGIGPVILDINCTNCGRCIDVCSKEVFRFATRFDNKLSLPNAKPDRATREQAPG